MKLVQPDDLKATYSAMGLIQSAANVMACGLNILGIQPKEELR